MASKREEKFQYIRQLRLQLGDALRRSHDALAPLMLMVEQGYRWEQDEMVTALEAADDLEQTAAAVDRAVGSFDAKGLRQQSKTRLREARLFLGKGVTTLQSIDGEDMVALAHRWEEEGLGVDKAHEAYFLTRFTTAMRILRLGWNKLFYATQGPSVRRIKLTLRQTSAYYDPMSGIRESVQDQARELAEKSSRYVEVIDADGDVAFVAQPSSTARAIEEATARKRARKPRRVRPIGRMQDNPTEERARDLWMFEQLWEMPY